MGKELTQEDRRELGKVKLQREIHKSNEEMTTLDEKWETFVQFLFLPTCCFLLFAVIGGGWRGGSEEKGFIHVIQSMLLTNFVKC